MTAPLRPPHVCVHHPHLAGICIGCPCDNRPCIGPATPLALAGSAPAPKPCRACSECEGDHHFTTEMIDFAEDEPDHPAALAGRDSWYVCKHCVAWVPELPDEDDLDVDSGGES